MSALARLRVESGPDAGRTFAIGARATLGRERGCEVRLRGASISRRHARLERTRAGWQVLDLGSTNGVLLGGRRVERAALEDEAELVLGAVRLRFVALGEEGGAGPAAGLRSAEARALLARAPRRAGLLGGDLEQRPPLARAALVLLALVAAALLAWGAYASVLLLRGGP